MHRNRSVDVHQFAMIPQADIPRSSFNAQYALKTTFDGGYLVPIYVDEVLPGDTFNLKMTAFARLATPLFPVMDNLHLDTFFFFVPNRLVWTNWVKFMGQQTNPADSTSYVVPTMTSPTGGYAVGSLQDYMGLPTVGQVGAGNTVTHASLFLRGYSLIWNEWFRDENLQNSVTVDTGDGPDIYSNYTLLRRGKRKDYFTGALPWPQKGTAVSLPLGTSAPVLTDSTTPTFKYTTGGAYAGYLNERATSEALEAAFGAATGGALSFSNTGLYADLSSATSATINQLRQSFQIQRVY